LHFSVITQKTQAASGKPTGEETKLLAKSFVSSPLPPSFFQKLLPFASAFLPRKKPNAEVFISSQTKYYIYDLNYPVLLLYLLMETKYFSQYTDKSNKK